MPDEPVRATDSVRVVEAVRVVEPVRTDDEAPPAIESPHPLSVDTNRPKRPLRIIALILSLSGWSLSFELIGISGGATPVISALEAVCGGHSQHSGGDCHDLISAVGMMQLPFFTATGKRATAS